MDELAKPDHWDGAYAKGAMSRSWFQSEASESLEFIASTEVGASASVVDIGGGASTLVDGLLARGFADLTVVDLSAEGLDVAKLRLAEAAVGVAWVVADVLAWDPGRTFDVWHDRAVLHFLTSDEDRRAYVARAASGVAPGGWITIGGFAPDGPTSCSGLPVRGASSQDLADLFAPNFIVAREARVVHTTPSGNAQPFAWITAQRT